MNTDAMKQTTGRIGGMKISEQQVDGRAPAPPARDPSLAGDGPAPQQQPKSGKRKGPITRKRLVWAAIFVVLAALIALSFRPTPLEVEVGTAVRGPLETTVDAEGVTRVRDRYQVAAPVSGRLERITLREGDAVAAGAVLARITPVPLDPQAAAQARARLSAALAGQQEVEARVAQIGAAFEQAQRSTARIREVATAGGMSVDAVERAELELASSAREFQAAQSWVRATAAEVAAARAALLEVDPARSSGRAVAEVRSPSAGRVLRVHQQSERIVPAGTPLVEVADAAGLEVVVDVLSTDAVRIQPGATMRVVEWGGEDALEGRVRLVEPAGFTKVSTLGVEEQRVNVIADLLQPPAALGDGYRVEARIVTWAGADVVKVPNSALFRTGTEWSVFVAEDGRARLRPVRVGHRGAAEAEVVEGLRAGEAVILFPSDRIRDGARVRDSRR
jgi:HlyD family secretion protein